MAQRPKAVIENPPEDRAPFDYLIDVAIGRPTSVPRPSSGPRANIGGPDTGRTGPRHIPQQRRVSIWVLSAPVRGGLDYCGESVAMCVSAGSALAAMGAPGYDVDDNFKSGTVYVVKQRRGPVSGSSQLRLTPYLIPNHRPDSKQFVDPSISMTMEPLI